MIEAPQSFVVREECAKAASEKGFRRKLGETGGWTKFALTTVPVEIYLAAGGPQGPWFLSLEDDGVIAELSASKTKIPGPSHA